MTITTTFRERLNQAIQSRPADVPIKVIAHRAGYSKGYLERLMSGRQSNPTIQAVESLATATGVSIAWLLGLPDSPH